MIKIIKKGKIPGEVERIKKCHKCKTIVYINNIEQKYIENLLIFQNAGEIMDIYLNIDEEVKNNEIYDN